MEHSTIAPTRARTPMPVLATDLAAVQAALANPNATVREFLTALGYTSLDHDANVRGALAELADLILFK